MIRFLLDTNICIFFMKGKYRLDKKIEEVKPENCLISEITLAELKFGVEHSEMKEKNRKVLATFLEGISILPIFSSLDIYAKEKSRLRKMGMTINDFDLLIGATSITHGLIMVTNNTDEFKRIEGIELIDWTR